MSMTKRELIEALKNFPDDMPVHFVYNYGDHWQTRVAAEVADVQSEKIKYSNYHSMDRLATDEEIEQDHDLGLDDDGEPLDSELTDVIALR